MHGRERARDWEREREREREREEEEDTSILHHRNTPLPCLPSAELIPSRAPSADPPTGAARPLTITTKLSSSPPPPISTSHHRATHHQPAITTTGAISTAVLTITTARAPNRRRLFPNPVMPDER
ncbi:uncharacterized protein LOC131335439 [Rhododendron vialii]|uniref:uncharacterized protein LOC131335439 n=1 Tax=Rhododendron vialii TaxID=182163 RepID=UPI00265F5A88|nr:uncharacterized protein LOC131335439 [Rhododendron vialii]